MGVKKKASTQPARPKRRTGPRRYNFEGAPVVPRSFPGPQRYVICPASDHLHQPQAVRVFPTLNLGCARFVCTCGTNGFLGRFDYEAHGHTIDGLAARRIPTEALPIERPLAPRGGKRYVICPLSYFDHAGLHAARVWHKSKYYCRCSCGTNWFMNNDWGPRHGFTLDELKRMGATAG